MRVLFFIFGIGLIFGSEHLFTSSMAHANMICSSSFTLSQNARSRRRALAHKQGRKKVHRQAKRRCRRQKLVYMGRWDYTCRKRRGVYRCRTRNRFRCCTLLGGHSTRTAQRSRKRSRKNRKNRKKRLARRSKRSRRHTWKRYTHRPKRSRQARRNRRARRTRRRVRKAQRRVNKRRSNANHRWVRNRARKAKRSIRHIWARKGSKGRSKRQYKLARRQVRVASLHRMRTLGRTRAVYNVAYSKKNARRSSRGQLLKKGKKGWCSHRIRIRGYGRSTNIRTSRSDARVQARKKARKKCKLLRVLWMGRWKHRCTRSGRSRLCRAEMVVRCCQ